MRTLPTQPRWSTRKTLGTLHLTVGRTIGASLSTQVVLPALTQTEAEDAASTVPGLCHRRASVSGGGDRLWAVAVAADRRTRTVLADAIAVDNTIRPT